MITCRFAIKMSIGLQMRNAQNLRETYSHLSLSENEVMNGLSTKKYYNINVYNNVAFSMTLL